MIMSSSLASACTADITGCGFIDVGNESLDGYDGCLNSLFVLLDVSNAWLVLLDIATPLVDSAVASLSVSAVVEVVALEAVLCIQLVTEVLVNSLLRGQSLQNGSATVGLQD